MANRRKYRGLPGALTMLALLTAAGFTVRRAYLSTQVDLVTYLDDSVGLTPSSPVQLHGIAVGHVRRVSLSGSHAAGRTVRIDMRFSRRSLDQIPEDSTIAIVAANLLGDKSLNISRGTHARPIAPFAELRSQQTQDIASVLNRAAVPLKKLDELKARFDGILKSVDQGGGSVGLLVNDRTLESRLEGIATAVTEIQGSVQDGRGVLFHISDIETEAKKPMARLDAMTGDFNRLATGLTPLQKQTAEVADEGRQLIDSAAKDKRPGELVKQAKQTADKASALWKRAQSTVDITPLQASLESVSAEYKGLLVDFGRHPMTFFEIRLGFF